MEKMVSETNILAIPLNPDVQSKENVIVSDKDAAKRKARFKGILSFLFWLKLNAKF